MSGSNLSWFTRGSHLDHVWVTAHTVRLSTDSRQESICVQTCVPVQVPRAAVVQVAESRLEMPAKHTPVRNNIKYWSKRRCSSPLHAQVSVSLAQCCRPAAAGLGGAAIALGGWLSSVIALGGGVNPSTGALARLLAGVALKWVVVVAVLLLAAVDVDWLKGSISSPRNCVCRVSNRPLKRSSSPARCGPVATFPCPSFVSHRWRGSCSRTTPMPHRHPCRSWC